MDQQLDNVSRAWAKYISLRRRFYLAFAALLLVGLLTFRFAGAHPWDIVPFVAVGIWSNWLWFKTQAWPCPCCGGGFNSFRRSLPGNRCVHCNADVGEPTPPS